jgi:Regulator of chromosome condensation (RCC1) repeat
LRHSGTLKFILLLLLSFSLSSCNALVATQDPENSSPYETIAAGAAHSCGLNQAGDVFCWEENVTASSQSQIVNNKFSFSANANPVAVPQGHRENGEKFVSLDAGDYHTCGTTTLGKVYCWGPPSSALGDGSSQDAAYNKPDHFNESLFPRHVTVDGLPAGDEFISVNLGRNHSCGVTKYGQIYCWGAGVDSGGDTSSPVQQPGNVIPNPAPAPPQASLCDGSPKDMSASPSSCPYGFDYVYDAPFSYCVMKDLVLPDVKLSPYCQYVNSGYLGFMWSGDSHPNGYICPFGYRLAPNSTGQYYCVFEGISKPSGVTLKPHCDLPQQTVGFKWCSAPPINTATPSSPQDNSYTCPSGFQKSYDGSFNFCKTTNISPPTGFEVKNYCQYLSSGSMGFSWSNTGPNNYTCPAGFYPSNNGQGEYYCLKSGLSLPATGTTKAHCHIAEGYLGFRW